MSESTPNPPGRALQATAFGPGTSFPLQPEGGTTVLLLVGRVDRRWAAQTAIELCSMWAQNGRRVVLADLHLENPVLHTEVGGENLEGVVDIFLYGASIARSARPVRGRGFYLIPSGTYEPDAEAIYHHPRWPKLVAGFRDASASLVLFAPAETVDVQAVSEWVTDVVLLGRPADTAIVEALASRGLAPAALLVAEEEPEQTEELPPPPSSSPLLDDPELRIPPPPVRTEERRRRGWIVPLVVLALAAVLAGAGFLLARSQTGLVPWMERADPAAEPVPADARPVAMPAANRLGQALPYSVQVIAYGSLDPAREELQRQRQRLDSLPVFISPERDPEGVLYYKILAGALPDTATAGVLREQLLTSGAVDPDDVIGTWDLIRFTPLAFDLGEFPTTQAATAASDSLLARDVPTYAVPVPYTDGSVRWQLYAGAYGDSVSAHTMREQLAAAGVQPRLVARIGASDATPQPPRP